MKKLMPFAVMCVLGLAGASVSAQAEEKTEIKTNKDGSWKMKIKRKGDKEWIGTYGGREYVLRGDYDFGTIKDFDHEYTVYGTMAPDDTYITTTKVVRVETR